MDPEAKIDGEIYEADAVDGELVQAHVTAITTDDAQLPAAHAGAPLTLATVPRLQTAAAAATGFVAGAATLALLRHYGGAKLERLAREQQLERRRPEPWPVGRPTTYIVHVRPLARPE